MQAELNFKAEMIGSWDDNILYNAEKQGSYIDIMQQAESWFNDKLIKRQKLDAENNINLNPQAYDASEDCYCNIYIYAPNGKQLKRICFEAGSSWHDIEADDEQLLFWQYTAGQFNEGAEQA